MPYQDSNNKKPPEVESREDWERRRHRFECERTYALFDAISRRYYDGRTIPIEWVDEYNELIERLLP